MVNQYFFKSWVCDIVEGVDDGKICECFVLVGLIGYFIKYGWDVGGIVIEYFYGDVNNNDLLVFFVQIKDIEVVYEGKCVEDKYWFVVYYVGSIILQEVGGELC